MRHNASQSIGVQCPTCGRFNDIDAARCTQCGRPLRAEDDEPDRSTDQSREAQIRKAHEASRTEAPAILKRNARRARQSTKLITFVGISFIMILLIVLIRNRIQVLQWEQEIEARYQAAVTCYQRGDYLCSRDSLLELLSDAPNYPNAADLLVTMRWELSRRYIAESQWEQAAAELIVLLPYAAERPEIRAALAQTYDARIQQAQARGDLGEVVRLNLERLSVLDF